MFDDDIGNPLLETLRQRYEGTERLLREIIFQHGAHQRQLDLGTRQRGADAGMAGRARLEERTDAVRHTLGEAIDRCGNAAGDGLAQHHAIWLQPVFAGIATGAGRHAVRLVDDQQRAIFAGQFAQCRVIAVVGQHHAHVGHDRFGQHASHIAIGQRRLERRNVVELDDLGELREVAHLADQGGVGVGRAAVDGHVGLIDRAVVAVIED